MADTTKEIAAGDLSQRVQVSSSGTEVGQLAVAFNTMLDEIQAAFAARDATEGRLRQFLADASHELRTPLTSIQGFAELFRIGADNPTVGTETIMRRIEEESARMKGLVEDLLLLARLDQVRQSERCPVDLSVLAADACSDATAAAPGRPVTLSAPQPVVVLGDEAHLRQAFGKPADQRPVSHPRRQPDRRGGPPRSWWGRCRGAGPWARSGRRGAGPRLRPLLAEGPSAGQAPGLGSGWPSWLLWPQSTTASVTAANAPGGGAVFTIRLTAGAQGPVRPGAPWAAGAD